MRITTNRFRAVSSRLARSMANLVSKKSRFGAVFRCSEAVFRTIVLKLRTIDGVSSGRLQ